MSVARLVGCSLALILFHTAGAAAGPRADLVVPLDEAKLLRMPERTVTVVVGNPLIADASPQTGGQLVITGKGYGMTNIIALDRAGNVLMNKHIEVQGPSGHIVTVYRGVERGTYSCTPNCERRITLGDGTTFFDNIIMQSTTRTTQAQGGSTPGK